MGERGVWAAVMGVFLAFAGAGLWLSWGYLPQASAAMPAAEALRMHPAGEARTEDGARYWADVSGRIYRQLPDAEASEMVFVTQGGLVRLASTGDRAFVAYEDENGVPLLAELTETRSQAEPLRLDAAASALLGLPDGRLLIGGVDGSLASSDGGSRPSNLQTRLPTWVRFLRLDEPNSRVLVVAADGARTMLQFTEEQLLVERVQPAADGTPYALHASLSLDPNPDPAEPFPPGPEFQECGACPEMVVTPAGSFLMGSPADEPGRSADEGPQREVTLRKFAIGKFEVTLDEWDACVADGFCRAVDNDRGWGRERRPVMGVSWQDVTGDGVEEEGFLAWVNSKVEGAPYRLPSEAEWEYAARAGTTTAYAFGAEITPEQANFSSNFEGGRTSSVGAYPANDFGLHDMHGNLWEWVQDCWHVDYGGAPVDGSAWMAAENGDCSLAVLRGGSWYDDAQELALRRPQRVPARRPGRQLRFSSCADASRLVGKLTSYPFTPLPLSVDGGVLA